MCSAVCTLVTLLKSALELDSNLGHQNPGNIALRYICAGDHGTVVWWQVMHCLNNVDTLRSDSALYDAMEADWSNVTPT